jgi:protein phosphatase
VNHKKIEVNPKGDYRLVVISDVHGHREIFERLLKKLALREEDHLVILGDFINRGIDSYDTCRFVQNLSKRKNTIVMKGNHEYFIHVYMETEALFTRFYSFIKAQRYETVIDSMLKAAGKTYRDFDSIGELYRFIKAYGADCFDFMKERPVLLSFDGFTFVHGGYDAHFDLVRDEGKFLKFDDFNVLSDVHKEKVIVGHWPTGNLRSDYLSNAPYFNMKKNIVFVDGGLGVKTTGELNALIIDKKDGVFHYDVVQENAFTPARIIREHVFHTEPDVFIRYPDFDVEILEHSKGCAYCRHVKTGRLFSVFDSMLRQTAAGTVLIDEYTNRFLNLSVGASVKVCSQYNDYVLVKHGENFGWLLAEQVSEEI